MKYWLMPVSSAQRTSFRTARTSSLPFMVRGSLSDRDDVARPGEVLHQVRTTRGAGGAAGRLRHDLCERCAGVDPAGELLERHFRALAAGQGTVDRKLGEEAGRGGGGHDEKISQLILSLNGSNESWR